MAPLHITFKIGVPHRRFDRTSHVNDVTTGAALTGGNRSAGLHLEGIATLRYDSSMGF
jgi:hypothetical protein